MPSDPYGAGRDSDADLDFDSYYEAERQEAEDAFASQDRAARADQLDEPYMGADSPSAADYDDTVYDQSDLNRAFDAAGVSFDDGLDPDEFSDEDDEEDGGGGRLWKVLLLMAMVLGFGGFIYYIYTTELMEGGDSTVPVVQAEEGAAKVKPEGPTGEQVPHQGIGVLNQGGNAEAKAPVTVLPPPAAPVPPAASQSAEQVLQSADNFRQRVEQVMGSVAPRAETSAPLGQETARANSRPPINVPAAPPLQQRSVPMTSGVPAPAQPMTRDAPPSPPSILDSSSSVSGAVRPPMPSDFPETRKAEASIAAPRAPQPQAPAAQVAAAPSINTPDPTPKPVPVPAARQQQSSASPTPSRNVPSSGFLVQLASMRSTSAARTQWQRLSGRHGDLLGSLSPDIQRADLGSRGVYYRLRVGPLESRQQASTLCSRLKQRSIDCLVVR